jgi:thioredoxin-related protein
MLARQFILGLVITFGAANAPNVFAIEQSQLKLKSLVSGDKVVLNRNEGLSTIAMIYQPGCKWCKKQGELLANIQRQCASHANIALIGADANTQKLRRELHYFDPNLAAFEANKKFLRKIKGVAAFPTTVIFDSSGKLIAKKRGYIEPKKLAQVMGAITKQHCDVTL